MPKRKATKRKRPIIEETPEAHDRAVMRDFRRQLARHRMIRALAKRVLREHQKSDRELAIIGEQLTAHRRGAGNTESEQK